MTHNPWIIGPLLVGGYVVVSQLGIWLAFHWPPRKFDCPRWLCRVLCGHGMVADWARYDTDQDGRRCYCGERWMQYGLDGIFDRAERRMR